MSRSSFTCSPLECTECSRGKLPLTPKQSDVLPELVRITGVSSGMAAELAKRLANHPDVPGQDHRNLHELIEDPAVVVIASLDKHDTITSISVGCLEQFAPSNDRHVQQGFAYGFMSDHEIDPVQGYTRRMQPLMGSILAVLVDPFSPDSKPNRGRGLGGAQIAAQMIIQGRAGNESVVGFCPSEGDPETTPVYRRILSSFGFHVVGRAIFGPVNPELFRETRQTTRSALASNPQVHSYALIQSMGAVGKHHFTAMTSDLQALGLTDEHSHLHSATTLSDADHQISAGVQ